MGEQDIRTKASRAAVLLRLPHYWGWGLLLHRNHNLAEVGTALKILIGSAGLGEGKHAVNHRARLVDRERRQQPLEHGAGADINTV